MTTMTLREYLKTNDVEAFARQVKSTPKYLTAVAGGWQRASLTLALRIETESGGQVPRWMLRPECRRCPYVK